MNNYLHQRQVIHILYCYLCFSRLIKKAGTVNCWSQKETCPLNKVFHSHPLWGFFHFHMKQLRSCQRQEGRDHGIKLLVRTFKPLII